jgi:deoxyhypusine synthase
MEVKHLHGNGSHLILDVFEADPEILKSKSKVKEFLEKIPKLIDMTPLTSPKVLFHEAQDPLDSGVTGFIVIAESHISVHTYPKREFASIDIFSCREFDTEKAVKFSKDFYDALRVERRTLYRGFIDTKTMEKSCTKVKGFKLDEDMKALDMLSNFDSIGFQASHLSQSIDILKKMKKENATIFMSFTSNMASSGLREIFAEIVKEKLVDVIITGVGSIEEDVMKSHKPFLMGSFEMDDVDLHRIGVNRIGNVLVPGERYEYFEDFIQPIFKELHEEQKTGIQMHSPSELTKRMGLKLKDENSFLYQAAKNNIPVYCPAITDGSLGLNVFFYKQKNSDFGIDTTGDMKQIAAHVLNAEKTGAIILGGGFAKHHIIGVNILREGLDYAIYVTTAKEGDGSLSGARPKEAKSWSKIKEGANETCIESDATLVFPFIALAMKKYLKGRKIPEY